MTYLAKFSSAARKRAAFRRTVAELEALPHSIKSDLNIDHDRAVEMARQAVYG